MSTTDLPLLDLAPRGDAMLDEVLAGLGECPKRLPSKYFYDARGSRLFDRIGALPEYYPTRTELAIMRRWAGAMAREAGARAAVIELGSGSGRKTPLLLAALDRPAAYVPVDIAREHLLASATALQTEFPAVEVRPVCADFLQPLRVPELPSAAARRVVYFPGSTIGNLQDDEVRRLLGDLARLVGPGGGLLIGLDLKKDPAILEAAYNDRAGVTAEFNRNLLRHINRRLAADIPLDAFGHHAPYRPDLGRIEMHLVALRDVEFTVGESAFAVAEGERIVTEYSHKYELREFAASAAEAGWRVRKSWTDPREWFAVVYAEAGGKEERTKGGRRTDQGSPHE